MSSTDAAIGATGGPGVGSEEEHHVDAPEPKKVEDAVSSIIGLLIWLAIIGGGLFWGFWTSSADVLLDVSDRNGFLVTGTVVSEGHRVPAGTVHLVIVDAKNKRYVAGTVVPVKDGAFTTTGLSLIAKDAAARTPQPLRVTAQYYGTNGTKEVSGFATAYVNFAPPLGTRTLATVGGISVVLILILAALFTGDLTRRKARMLFAVTYLMTLLSLAVPIVLTILVSQSTYLVEMMREAPIGLVKGTAKGVSDPQWLVNIGGAVEAVTLPDPKVAPPPTGESTAPAIASGTPAAPADQIAPVAPAPVAPAPAAPAATTAATAAVADSTPEGAPIADIVKVVGGLAVPFYVVMLAMLGAGINMTRKVPPVQIEYENQISPNEDKFWAATVKAPLAWLFPRRVPITTEQRKATAEIRRHLIENYMDLLSAPFLAIAVYYLLQAIGSNPAEPVLVLMAFATGLMADALIDRIRKFAKDMVAEKGETSMKVAATETTSVTVKHEESVTQPSAPLGPPIGSHVT